MNIMTIETKFNVNDLVQYKYQKPNRKITALFEVIEIKTQTCYIDAQVFYVCRSIHGHADYNKGKYEIVDFGPGFGDTREYCTFRQDELKPCDQALVTLLNSEQNADECDASKDASSNADGTTFIS